MRRRKVLTLMGSAAVAWPANVFGQKAMPVIGFVNDATRQGYVRHLAAFLQGLRVSGSSLVLRSY